MKHNRRDMVKKGLGILSVASLGAFVPLVGLEARRKRGGEEDKKASGPQLIDVNSAMAKGVNYHHDKANIKDDSLKVEKMGLAWKDQYCKNCTLYQAGKGGDNQGGCTIFPGKLVKADGWCTTWAKKA